MSIAVFLSLIFFADKAEIQHFEVISKLLSYELAYWSLFIRGKNILEQLSRTGFFTGFENRAFFLLLRSTGEKGANFKSRKNRVLESYSNFFFTLVFLALVKTRLKVTLSHMFTRKRPTRLWHFIDLLDFIKHLDFDKGTRPISRPKCYFSVVK